MTTRPNAARAPTETSLRKPAETSPRKPAESSLRKEERAKDGALAMMEYQANGRMIREKTARLRALRLAKQAGKQASDTDA